jgi:hypothetical protein
VGSPALVGVAALFRWNARPVGLESLPALRFLFAGANDLDAIAALPLRGLSLSGVEKDTDLGPLATSTTIEMLDLRVHTAAQVAVVARLPLRNSDSGSPTTPPRISWNRCADTQRSSGSWSAERLAEARDAC